MAPATLRTVGPASERCDRALRPARGKSKSGSATIGRCHRPPAPCPPQLRTGLGAERLSELSRYHRQSSGDARWLAKFNRALPASNVRWVDREQFADPLAADFARAVRFGNRKRFGFNNEGPCEWPRNHTEITLFGLSLTGGKCHRTFIVPGVCFSLANSICVSSRAQSGLIETIVQTPVILQR